MIRVVLQLMVFLILTLGCGSPGKTSDLGISPHQESVMKYLDSGWNSRNVPDLKQILAEGYERNLNGIPVVKGTAEMETYILNYKRAFPNLEVSVDQWLESGDRVVAVWTFEGTNTGEFGEHVPTGKKAMVSGISLFNMDAENRIEREDTYYNELYLLQQLGYKLVPPNLE